MASPLQIQMLLHFWTRPTRYAEGDADHRNSPAVQALFGQFVSSGLLERTVENEYGEVFKATDALGVYAEALCSVPWPVQVWVIPQAATSGERQDG